MRRREFIALIGGAAAWPGDVWAQRSQRTPRIGILFGTPENDPQTKAALPAFTKALEELGWTDGRNIRIDTRFASADVDRMTAYAKELVGLHCDVIVAHTTPVVAALQHEAKTTPVVFVVVSDPVGSGFIASLSHPGGNITGFIDVEASLSGKWVDLIKALAPGTARVALMFNPATAPFFNYYLQPLEAAARAVAIEASAAQVGSGAEIERVLANLSDQPGTSLVVMPDAFTITQRNYDLIIALAARYRIPTTYPNQSMVAAGGLASYGVDNIDLFRRAPAYIDRILRGANPADLPVQLPTKFELSINLKTAKALGLNVPATLLATADEVIE